MFYVFKDYFNGKILLLLRKNCTMESSNINELETF